MKHVLLSDQATRVLVGEKRFAQPYHTFCVDDKCGRRREGHDKRGLVVKVGLWQRSTNPGQYQRVESWAGGWKLACALALPDLLRTTLKQ